MIGVYFRCLSNSRCQETSNSTRCELQLNQNSTECTLNYDFPAKYNHIIDTSVVPSLFELCKRKFYEIISDTAKKLTPPPRSIYCDFHDTGYNENNNYVKSLQESLNNFNINSNDYNDDNNNKKDLPKSNKESSKEFDDMLLTTKRKGSCVPKDMIEEYFYYLPRFIKNDLCNGPLSRCENVRCKKPIFDYVYYEFCIE